MILNNLSTTSDGKQLESGGMIRIEATCNGEPVPMTVGRTIGILIPTDTVLPSMKLFTATRDSSSEILNWSGKQDVDAVDYRLMCWFCAGTNVEKSKCPFFFCGIRSFFRNIFTSTSAKQKKSDDYNNLLTREANIVRKYQLDTAQLAAALRRSKNNNPDIIKYYAFQNFGWGYRNCDRYRTGVEYKNLYVKEAPRNNIDAKFIEKSTKSIVPAFSRNNDYLFSDLLAGQDGWAVSIKLTDNKIFLSFKTANSNDKNTIPEYKEVTIGELKQTIRSTSTVK